MEQVLTLTQRESKQINLAVFFEVAKLFTKILIKTGLIGIVVYNIFLANEQLNTNRIIPMKIESTETKDLKRTKEALVILKLSNEKIPKYADSIIMGAKVAGVDPVLIATLMYTESRFSLTAKSSMNYKGVLQTPSKTGFLETDTIHGCNILKEKLQIANGDVHKGLTFFKGSKYDKNSVGYKQASEVIALYNTVNKQINRG